MTSPAKYLKSVLVGESKAYGFTIAFWGSGMVMVSAHNTPTIFEILSFGFGGVLGFGLLATLFFRSAFNNATDVETPDYVVLSTIHYLGALAPILASYFFVTYFPSPWMFLLAGMSVSIIYNLLVMAEYYLSMKIVLLDDRLDERI